MLRLAKAPLTRDALAEMFWGGQPESRAKHSLSDALSHLRQVLGADAIRTRQSTIELSGSVVVSLDAAELVAAAVAGNHARVVELYAGPFLNGVVVEDSPAFENWLSAERERLRAVFAKSCEHECGRLAAEGAWPACAELARRWLEEDVLSVKAAGTLLEAVYEPRTEADYQRARVAYQQLADRISREHDIEIDDRVARLMTAITRDAATRGYPLDVPAYADTAATTTRSRGRRAALLAGAVAVIAFVAILATMWRREPAEARPALAVLQIENVPGDSSTAWLEAGLPQMLAASLARVQGLDVIAPERVREVRRRAHADTQPVSAQQAVRLARDLGATIAVMGGIARGDSLYVLALTMYDARTGRQLGAPQSVQHRDLIALTDAAVARIAGMIDVSGSQPRFADIETSSLQAYQSYVRAKQATDERRFADARHLLDDALARDSNFVSAVVLARGLAIAVNDTVAVRLYDRAVRRTIGRASEFDRLTINAEAALYGGEHGRAEQLGRELVERYPRDPRAYATYGAILQNHGRNDDAERLLLRALALDSLGMAAGTGPCAPCVGYFGITGLRLGRGDLAGAERAARRWTELQPDNPGSWYNLAAARSFAGRFDEASAATRREAALQPGPDVDGHVASILVMAGRFDEAETILRRLDQLGDEAAPQAFDLRVTLARERGQHLAAVQAYDHSRNKEMPGVIANSMARIGRVTDARAIYERLGHSAGVPSESPIAGTHARGFSWSHALLADALADVADTAWLRTVSDSIQAISTRSYYGRDWRLHHHIRGILAARGGQWSLAAEEFQAARWCVACWTSVNVRLADAQLHLQRPHDALQTLREGLMGPLDAMGRYTPRTELLYHIARVFTALGEADSARVYAQQVRMAWQNADRVVRARLDSIP